MVLTEFRHGPSSGPASHHPNAPLSNMRRSRFDQAPKHSAERPHASVSNTWNQNDQQDDGEDIDGMPFDEENLKPQKSYMALPAGIMTPLVSMNSVMVCYDPIFCQFIFYLIQV